MHNTLISARDKLIGGGYTCVVLTDTEEYCSRERGVSPLISLIESGRSYVGAFAADKTVGAGAAYLYVLIGVRALWAGVISESAQEILSDNGIEVFSGERVPYIINRRGDGICPIENAVRDAEGAEDAYRIIQKTLAELRKNP